MEYDELTGALCGLKGIESGLDDGSKYDLSLTRVSEDLGDLSEQAKTT